MKTLILILIYFMSSTLILFDFNSSCDISNWTIVDDGVMGGRSNGNFKLNEDGYGVFSGYISLENNGGFSSLRYDTKTLDVSNYTKAILTIKGDGKVYQFRVKSNNKDYASYIYEFKTTEDWMTVEVPFEKMIPQFRGKKLNMPNYEGGTIEEVTFLIGNKKEESFKLLIDKIELK